MKSESELEQKPSERARRVGHGSRVGAGLLVAALMANGLACVARARADAGMRARAGRGAPIASSGELLGGGGGGAEEPSAVGEGAPLVPGSGNVASSGPLSEVTAAVSSANVQRLRDVARID